MASSTVSSRSATAGRWLARLNFAAAGLAAALTALGLVSFVVAAVNARGHPLWGLFLAVWALPFAGAFWLSGHAWRRRWRARGLLQLAPALVLAGWMAAGWLLRASSGAQAP